MSNMGKHIGAVVLAAGLSQRMGSPKTLLPWGDETIISHIVKTLMESGLEPIVVVAGGFYAEITDALSQLACQVVFNPNFANGEMLASLQTGLKGVGEEVDAVLIALGDQPQLEKETIQSLYSACEGNHEVIVIPSYNMRRGHPWLITRHFIPQILKKSEGNRLSDFVVENQAAILYVKVQTPTILQDIDTQEDYWIYLAKYQQGKQK